MLAPGSLIVRGSDLITAPVGSDIAMLDIESGSYFVLDEIAAAIWGALETPTTASRICDTLRQRYDVAPAQCESDVMQFLVALHRKGLLRIVE